MDEKLSLEIKRFFRANGTKGGKIGGKATTPAKQAAARKNGAKGGRPPKVRR